MQIFAWLSRKVYEAMAEGMRRFAAEVNPEQPPQTVEELKALVAAPPPALPPASPAPGEGEPAKPRAKK